MTTLYHLDFYDASGDLQFVITDYTAFSYTRQVNYPGLLQFSVRGDHPILSVMQDKWQIEVWRKMEGEDWYRDFVAIYRQSEWYYGENGSRTAITCPGLMSMLNWRIVAYYAGLQGLTDFLGQPAETIMKTLVEYNAGPSATTGNGRIRDGAITGLSVEVDGGNGNVLNWYCAWQNLLESIQGVSDIGGGDFDLVKTSPTTWSFRWYTGQLGTDRSSDIIFAMERGNMAEPTYRELRLDEKSVCIVGGQGEGVDRDISVRTGTNYATGNNIEMFANANDIDLGDTTALEDRGDAKLVENEAQFPFNFKILQTPATLYGEHYFLGDLVTAVNPFVNTSGTYKINKVQITMDDQGNETVEVETK